MAGRASSGSREDVRGTPASGNSARGPAGVSVRLAGTCSQEQTAQSSAQPGATPCASGSEKEGRSLHGNPSRRDLLVSRSPPHRHPLGEASEASVCLSGGPGLAPRPAPRHRSCNCKHRTLNSNTDSTPGNLSPFLSLCWPRWPRPWGGVSPPQTAPCPHFSAGTETRTTAGMTP